MVVLRRALDYALPICMMATIAAILTDVAAALWIARVALPIYLAAQWRTLARMPRGILLAALVLAAVIVFRRQSPLPLLLDALDRFCFFATFVAALGLLRMPAERSSIVRDAGRVLIRQRPTRRYPTLALGATLFGMIINIGTLNLFGAMINRSNSLKAAGGHAAVQQARERRMMLALMRGFSLLPLVSPLGIAMAVILSSMPSLRWTTIAPVALPTAGLVFLLGWLLDWTQRPRQLAALVPEIEPAPLKPLGHFLLLAGAITLSVFAISLIGGLRLPVAVLLTCSAGAIVWLALQRRRLGGGMGLGRAITLLRRHLRSVFGAPRNELAVMGGSAFIGILIVPLVDKQLLSQALAASGLHGTGAAIAAMLAVIALAQIGLSSIVSVTLLASVLPNIDSIGLAPAPLAVALMSGWTLSMLSSPFTAAMQILAQVIGRSPYTVGWRWNGLLFALAVPVLCLWLFVLGAL